VARVLLVERARASSLGIKAVTPEVSCFSSFYLLLEYAKKQEPVVRKRPALVLRAGLGPSAGIFARDVEHFDAVGKVSAGISKKKGIDRVAPS
jgi:hypothetical protein